MRERERERERQKDRSKAKKQQKKYAKKVRQETGIKKFLAHGSFSGQGQPRRMKRRADKKKRKKWRGVNCTGNF